MPPSERGHEPVRCHLWTLTSNFVRVALATTCSLLSIQTHSYLAGCVQTGGLRGGLVSRSWPTGPLASRLCPCWVRGDPSACSASSEAGPHAGPLFSRLLTMKAHTPPQNVPCTPNTPHRPSTATCVRSQRKLGVWGGREVRKTWGWARLSPAGVLRAPVAGSAARDPAPGRGTLGVPRGRGAVSTPP